MNKFKDPLDSDEPFRIPESFWKQMEEFTAGGGFICFYTDNFGNIQFNCSFDSELAEEGIRSFGSRFLNSLNASREISETQSFLDSDFPPEDFDDSDD